MAKTHSHRQEADDRGAGAAPLLRQTGPVRFWTFLAINVAGFVVVNAFWNYLCTGRWRGFSLSAFHHAILAPIGQIFFRPLSLFEYPWMIAVTGLLLGVVILVPVIVAVLYRLHVAALFVLIVAVIGHAPVLAAVLAAGCVLAARTALRSDMPHLAVFLGLLPAGAYLFVFGFTGPDDVAVLPLQRWILHVPRLLAMVSAVVSAGAALWLARVTRYRPGVVAPVLVVLLAAPMLIFYLRVKPAELDYALIAQSLGPADLLLPATGLDTWRLQNRAQGLNEQTLVNRIEDDLKARRADLQQRCDAFLRRFPTSKRAPSVLWIRAEAASLRFDRRALASGSVSYSAEYPLPAAAEDWRRLREAFPGSPQAALADWRLAVLALRDRDVNRADDLLRRAVEVLQPMFAPAEAQPADGGDVFSRPAALPSSAYYAEALFAVRRLLWLIQQNDLLRDARAAEAAAAYLGVDGHAMTQAEYYARMAELAGRYEDTRLSENFKLAVAGATASVGDRAEQLAALARQWGDADAAIEANYELARLLLEEPVLQLKPDLQKPEAYLKNVEAGPPSPWQQRARGLLDWMPPPAKKSS